MPCVFADVVEVHTRPRPLRVRRSMRITEQVHGALPPMYGHSTLCGSGRVWVYDTKAGACKRMFYLETSMLRKASAAPPVTLRVSYRASLTASTYAQLRPASTT